MKLVQFISNLSRLDPGSLRLLLVTAVFLGLICSIFLLGSALSSRFLYVERRKLRAVRKAGTSLPLGSDHHWSIGTFLVTLGLVAVSLQGLALPGIAILGANFFLLFGILLIGRGMRIFSHRRTLGWALIGYLASFTVASAYFTFVQASAPIRITLFSVAASLSFVDTAITVFMARGNLERRASILAGSTFSFMALFFAVRAISSVFVPLSSLLSPGLLSSLTFVVFCLGMVAWTLSLILLRNERLLSEVLRAESLYRGIFENAAVGIFQSTPDGHFTRINTAFARVFGYPTTEAFLASQGTSTAWVYESPEVREGLYAILGSQGHFEEAEVQTRSRDGSVLWVSVNASLVKMGSSETVLTGSVIDVTARHLEGEALARSRDEKALLLQELQHRVKNGMGVIASLVGLEAGRTQDEAVRDALSGLEGKISALSSLYDLLYRSGGATTVGLDEYLGRLVDNFISSHGPGERGISLEVELEALQISFKRAESLGLVVVELLTNALKHAFPGEGCGRIMLSLRSQDKRALLRVEDDGKGLAPDFALEASTGLGMAILSTLASQLGGDFTVSPHEGRGTSFSLDFPL